MNSVRFCLFVALLLYKMLAFNQYCFLLLFHSVQIKTTGSMRAVGILFDVINDEKRNEKEREGEKKGKREKEQVNEKKERTGD